MTEPITLRHAITIAKPREAVFDAIADPAQLARYFVSHSSGPLVPGETVTWTWGEIRDETHCVELARPQRIVLSWKAYQVETRTRFTVTLDEAPEGKTRVSIEETGWPRDDEASLASALEHSGGWMHMLLCLKAYLEHGIDLRS